MDDADATKSQAQAAIFVTGRREFRQATACACEHGHRTKVAQVTKRVVDAEPERPDSQNAAVGSRFLAFEDRTPSADLARHE